MARRSASTDPSIVLLSSPVANDASFQAAKALLARADPGAEIDSIYGRLLRQRTLLAAMAHLESAGADLERLTVSAEHFKASWPLNSLFPTPDQPLRERLSLASIRCRLETHSVLLQSLTANVTEMEDEVVLLFGRAFDVAYPLYRHRMDYDVDLLVSEMDTGLRLLTRLRTQLGFILGTCKICRLGGRWMARLGLESSSLDGHLLHIDLIVGGWPAGPGTLLPPWSLLPVAERARQVQWRQRTVRVPAAEDMLLTLGAKISRHVVSPLVVPSGGLIRKDVNDALHLLTTDRDSLDWDYIARSAQTLNSCGVLHCLIRDAEVQAGQTLAPAADLARLAPGMLERQVLAVAERAAEEERGGRATKPTLLRRLVLRLWPGFSLLRHVMAARGRLAALAMVLADRSKELLLGVERRLGESTHPSAKRLATLLRRLRGGYGFVCELGLTPSPVEGRCASQAARKGVPLSLDPDAARILNAIRPLLPERAELARIRSTLGAHLHWRFEHHCERVLFNVDTSADRE